MPSLAKKSGFAKTADFVAKYPKVDHKDALDNLLRAIGLKQFGFDEVREKSGPTDYSIFGYPASDSESGESSSSDAGSATTTSGENTEGTQSTTSAEGNDSSTSATSSSGADTPGTPTDGADSSDTNSASTTTGTSTTGGGASSGGTKALSTTNPKSVKEKFLGFTVIGPNREKIVDLVIEAIKLDVKATPLAFCFVLRSMFDLSASIYSKEKGINRKRPKSRKDPELVDKSLGELLKDIYAHIISGKTDKTLEKELFGAQQELRNAHGILSVTSMNQLIHNPSFTVDTPSVCRLFHNIFPLLKAMNS